MSRLFPSSPERFPRWISGVLAAVFLAMPVPAAAVQLHGPPEGYLVHMMAHVFFSVALVFMLYILYKRPPGPQQAWKYFRLSLILFLLWNIDTFTVHWLAHRLPHTAIFADNSLAENYIVLPLTVRWVVYYLGRYDHLLCVPAIWFLMCSLGDFCLEVEKRQRQERQEADSPP